MTDIIFKLYKLSEVHLSPSEDFQFALSISFHNFLYKSIQASIMSGYTNVSVDFVFFAVTFLCM